MPFLEAKQITKQFGGLTAVSKVDFTLEKGMIAGLIGPNGAGKTTFFNMITGVYTPTTGTLTFNGQPIAGLKPNKVTERGIARTFQNIRLFANGTALENVLIGMHCRLKAGLLDALLGPWSPTVREEEPKARKRALELLDYVGLGADQATVTSKNLAYGDQRRLEIARALASNPQVLLLDEPTAGMNPQETAELTSFINRLRQPPPVGLGLTILLIEHHMRVVMGISDRVTVLDHGIKIAEGTPHEVQRDPQVIEAYLGKGTGK